MPSDNEIKQIMREKVFPFFNGGELDKIVSSIEQVKKAKEEVRKAKEEIFKVREELLKIQKDKISKKEVRRIAEEVTSKAVNGLLNDETGKV